MIDKRFFPWKIRLYFIMLGMFVFILIISVVNSARLPVVGGDDGNWGTILNEFLEVSISANGTLLNINNTLNNSTKVTGNLTVTGIMETTRGGIKFADGSTQIRGGYCFTSVQLSSDTNNTTGAIYSNGCWTRKEGALDSNFQNHSATQSYIYIDNITGRMWTTESKNVTRVLNDSIIDCDNSSIGGYTDWRLPAFSDAFTAAIHGIVQAISGTDEDGDGNTDDSNTGGASMWTATERAIGGPTAEPEPSNSNQLVWQLANPTSGQADVDTSKGSYRCVR